MDQHKEEPLHIEHRQVSSQIDLASTDKAPPVVKKTPLRELRPDNRTAFPHSPGISFLKDKLPTVDATRISATKRSSPECSGLHHNQSPSSFAANNHLVYVRRRSETEAGKATNFDGSIIASDYPLSSVEDPKLTSQTTEPILSCLSTLAPIASSSGKPLTSSLGMSDFKSASLRTDNGCASATCSPLDDNKRMKISQWEERYYQLQQLLRSLEQSDRKEYLQMLRSLSSAELSRHAVELEKRSIQLSLEEAKEMQRVGMLNVLGKSNG